MPATESPKDTIITKPGALGEADPIAPDTITLAIFFFYKSNNKFSVLPGARRTYLARELTT